MYQALNLATFISFWQIELGAGKKAIVIFVPIPQQKAFQKVQQR
jgi:hypothetical protein